MIPAKSCACGCGEMVQPTRKHPRIQYRKGHGTRLQEPLYEVIDRGFGSSCWEWLHAKTTGGYGQRRHNGRTQNAHRVMYEEAKGIVIPGHLHVDHLCRNRICVNPDHMEVVPSRVNHQRGAGAKLTPELVMQIKETEGEISCREWGRRLGMSHTVASGIRTGKRWANITGAGVAS